MAEIACSFLAATHIQKDFHTTQQRTLKHSAQCSLLSFYSIYWFVHVHSGPTLPLDDVGFKVYYSGLCFCRSCCRLILRTSQSFKKKRAYKSFQLFWVKHIDGKIYHSNIMVLIATAQGLFIWVSVPIRGANRNIVKWNVGIFLKSFRSLGNITQFLGFEESVHLTQTILINYNYSFSFSIS